MDAVFHSFPKDDHLSVDFPQVQRWLRVDARTLLQRLRCECRWWCGMWRGCSRAEYCTLQETDVAGWKMDEHEHGPFQDSKTYFLLKMWAQVQLWFWKFGKRNSAAPEVEPLGGVGGDGDKECRHRYRPGSWYLLCWIRWQRHCGHLPKRGVTKRNSILGGLHRPRAVAGWQCSGPGEVQCQEYVQKL